MATVLPPASSEIVGTAGVPDNGTARAGISKLLSYCLNLLGSAGTPAAARTALGATATRRVQGLVGINTTATPLTKYDLSADSVLLVDSAGASVSRFVTGLLTCDLGLAGSAANGRDQAGAFATNTWINLFFIWNGTTLATVASTASVTAGPVLPSGYTHWAFATSLRWNVSSQLPVVFTNGALVTYRNSGIGQLLSAGSSGSETALTTSTIIPPNCSSFLLGLAVSVTTNATGAGSNIGSLRVVTGVNTISVISLCPTASGTVTNNSAVELPNVNSNTLYYINALGGNGITAAMDVFCTGYRISNGG